jgi:HEXXH motif-containing protein
MAVMAEVEPRFEVNALSVASMGDEAAHFVRLLNAGESTPIFAAREPQYWNDFDLRVGLALNLIEAASPPLAAEIRALVVQAIGAEPRDPARSFGSVSSLTLWGAATINLESHRTVLDIAAALVHEAAHLLLFACAIDDPLVANPDTDRFVSPLRRDARPMDGVFHATFVCARLFYFFSALAARRPEALSGDDLATVEDGLSYLAARFDDGAETIVADARLTACGKDIFDSTLDFMSHAAA